MIEGKEIEDNEEREVEKAKNKDERGYEQERGNGEGGTGEKIEINR